MKVMMYQTNPRLLALLVVRTSVDKRNAKQVKEMVTRVKRTK